MFQRPLSHAYLIVGDLAAGREAVVALIEEEMGALWRANPDVHVRDYERLYAEDAQAIVERVQIKGDRSFVVAVCVDMTSDAQNKLLKTIEEPTAGSHVFIVVPSAHLVLPTIRSRVQTIEVRGARADALAAKFVALPVAERLAEVAELVASIKDDEESKMRAVELIDAVTERARAATPRDDAFLRRLLAARGYLFDQSPSVKNILEWLALSTPQG
jgi:hypothetical protein